MTLVTKIISTETTPQSNFFTLNINTDLVVISSCSLNIGNKTNKTLLEFDKKHTSKLSEK